MDEPAPKRRRTSPRSSREPPSTDAPRSSPSRSIPQRPSWASPTKASMSRWTPQILERRASASPSKSPSPRRSPSNRRPSFAAGDRATSNAQRQQQPENVLASVADDTEVPRLREGADEGGSELNRPTLPAGNRRAGAAAPIRSPAKPSPRPLPPPGPEGDDDYNPFLGRTLRRSPNTGIRIPPPAEPELPPSVDDPVSSTPARGIHSSSSPSRRRSKRQPAAGSPLKQPPLRPGEDGNEQAENVPRKLFGGKPTTQPTRLRQTTILAVTSNNIRRLPKQDANTAKRKERDALRAQLEDLKRDLDVTTRQNDRIRAMQKTGRKVPLADEEKITAIIRKQLLPWDEESNPSQTQILARAALDPMAILPFGKAPTSAITSEGEQVEISNIKTHHPVAMTAEEERPFLELFTPFSISAQLSVLPKTKDEPLRQLFTIQLRSRLNPGLFAARLEVTVDAVKLSILNFEVAGLEPAAKAELGPFLDKICEGDCNRSMQRNVGITTWAMAEWLRVAEQRARLWAQLHSETRTKDGILETSRNARSRKAKRVRDAQDPEPEEASITTQELLRFMGEQSFDLEIPPAQGSGRTSSLRLTWKIGFDWSGEAQSQVGILTGLPGEWRHADRKGALGKLPSVFENLVESGEEPQKAVRKILSLLVGPE